MQILNLSMGQDTGGQQLRMAAAFRRHAPEDRYVSMTQRRTFYDIPERFDVHRIRHDLWPKSDVVHLHNDLTVHRHLRNVPPKPTVIHYHGSAFRSRPDHYLEQLQRIPAVPIASTLDLVAIAPEVLTWLPAPYDPDLLLTYRSAPSDPDTLHIVHAPTNRAIKGTDVLIAAVDRMRAEGYRVSLDIIEKQPHAECLRRKGQADVYVDQLLLGYGCNAVEAFGMGIPVIAGIDVDRCEQRIRQKVPATTPALMEATWDGFPFMPATEETLYDALMQMRNADTRRAYALKGLEHFSRFHSAEKVVPMLRSLYQKAIEQ